MLPISSSSLSSPSSGWQVQATGGSVPQRFLMTANAAFPPIPNPWSRLGYFSEWKVNGLWKHKSQYDRNALKSQYLINIKFPLHKQYCKFWPACRCLPANSRQIVVFTLISFFCMYVTEATQFCVHGGLQQINGSLAKKKGDS